MDACNRASGPARAFYAVYAVEVLSPAFDRGEYAVPSPWRGGWPRKRTGEEKLVAKTWS